MEAWRTVMAPLHPEGRPFVAVAGLATVVLFLLWAPAGWLALVATLWMAYFFRDPPRQTPLREGLVVSPGDGVVQEIVTAAPPPELEMGATPRPRISIFLNVFNVHVNRVPASGRITRVRYHPGRFLNAALDKASEDNERQAVRMTTTEGKDIAFVQIAGLVARRIVCDLYEGRQVLAGERYGIIRFGSRLDVYLDEGMAPLVVAGQQAVGGETVLADSLSEERQRLGEER